MCVYNYSNPLIFTYHSISSNFHVGLNSVHPNRFRKHIEFIANLNNSTVENNHIKIAFDDGYESVYTNAFPIMEEYGLKGIVFPITGYIGKRNNWDVTFGINKAMHLNIDQILSLSDNGWEIGSHGHLHKSFKWLKIDEIKKDVEISKIFIENIIGKEAISFCLPFGDLTKKSINIIEEAGFTKLFMQLPLLNRKLNTQKLQFNYSRSIYGIDSVKSLTKKYNNSIIEHLKESFIHSFSTATVLVKEML